MSIPKWLTGYPTGGPDALTRRTPRDTQTAPRAQLNPDQQARLIQHASTQGFRTIREAVAWCCEALGVGLSERPMRRLFEPLGFKRQVPRPMAVRANAALQAQGRVWRGVEGARGVLGAAGGVWGRAARGVHRSGASVLEGVRGQVVSAGGASVSVVVLAGSS